jgi:ABC-2 type transport system ATP-binding protein
VFSKANRAKESVEVAAIRVEGLSKSFGKVPALQGLDLEVTEGEVLGYLGPNGAGKANLGN